MDIAQLKKILEAILLAAGRPLSLNQLQAMFEEQEQPDRGVLRESIAALQEDYLDRGIDLVQVAGGYRIQVRNTMQPWIARLHDEKPARYSRALLETLALVAYRQPITRGEIEDVRGVSVSSSIIKTLQERDWIHVVGHRDVPGRPAMYATTKQFLDYFSLKSLNELPSLSELRDLSAIGAELQLDLSDIPELQLEPANDDAESASVTIDEDIVTSPAETPDDETTATLH